MRRPRLIPCLVLCAIAGRLVQAQGGRSAAEIPIIPGLTFVLAVHNPDSAPNGSGIAVGDYEMVVGVGAVTSEAITLKTTIDAQDERKQQLQLGIERRIPLNDMNTSRLQILGFHTQDTTTLEGTTALGPSLDVLRDLRTTGRAAYSVKNFNHLSTSSGTLERAGAAAVPFSVLINGQRTELPAMRVTGRLTYNGNTRPWEFFLLDHPKFPLTLRFAVGGVGKGFPFDAEVTREIVRIDFPAPLPQRAVEDGLSKDCRVEVPGLYFDFNRATINPQSKPTLDSLADLLKRHSWNVTIEGHTDNVGSDAYNDDLSSRRAAAVKTALVRDYSIAASRLASAGFGEKRPRETNDTIAGRARNRRVELVRDCSKAP